MSSLDAVFRPGSAAAYGASRHSAGLDHVLLRNVLTGGFEELVVAVNPSRERRRWDGARWTGARSRSTWS